MSTFLPEGYENLKTEKSYWKPSQMKDGDNKFRIVAKPIAGWLDWKDKKPERYKPNNKPKSPFDSEKPIKAFWALYVWDYAREGLYILELTQAGLLKSLAMFATDEDWGDFTKYDFKINKQGSGMETKYVLTPMPHKPLSPKIEEALNRSPVRLEALYEGGDPWTDLEPVEVNEDTGEISVSAVGSPMETLKEHLEVNGIDAKYLEECVLSMAEKGKKTVDIVIQSALIDKYLPKFIDKYVEYVAKRSELSEAV